MKPFNPYNTSHLSDFEQIVCVTLRLAPFGLVYLIGVLLS